MQRKFILPILALAVVALAVSPALATHYAFRQQVFVSRLVTPYVPSLALIAPLYPAPLVAPIVAPACGYTAPAYVAPVQQVKEVEKVTVVEKQVVPAPAVYPVLPLVASYHNPFAALVSHSALVLRQHGHGVQQIRVERVREVRRPLLRRPRAASVTVTREIRR